MEIIHLEDNHQDFLRIIGDKDVIVETEPYHQSWLVGREYMIDGDILFFREGDTGVPLKRLVKCVKIQNSGEYGSTHDNA
jgi:hypothetical protein